MIWSIVAVANVGLMLVLFSGLTGAFGLVMSPILILNILLSTILAIYHFKLHTIDYLRLKGTSLSIHKGPISLRKTLNLSEIEQGRILANKLVLILKNEKEVKINLSLLTIKDYEKLHAELLRFIPINQQYGNS